MIVILDSFGSYFSGLIIRSRSKRLFLSDLEVYFVSEANLVLLLTFLNSYTIAVLAYNEGTLLAQAEPDQFIKFIIKEACS